MKKIISLILFSSALLVSCGSNTNSTPSTKEPEVVDLTLSNYQKYITGYLFSYSTSTTLTTYINFLGSSLCKFDNAIISYSRSNESGVTHQCELSISGNGQYQYSFSASGSGSYSSFSTTITNVTGKVTILF